MDKIKKSMNFIPIIMLILFIGLYFIYQNGYYDKMVRDKIMLTNEQIEKFEQDIIDGNDVSIDNYVEESKNYSTKISKISLELSDKFNNLVDKGIKFIFKKVSKVVE